MIKPFKIATSNANGLAKHSQKIKTFIFSQNILLVSETHFINKNYCRIPGYTMYHTIHSDSKAHRRIILIIRSDIKCYEIDFQVPKRILAD